VLVARRVTVVEYGTYSFILAFALFFQMLADSGLSTILIRELAVAPEKMGEILGAALALVWIMTFAIAALMAPIILLLPYAREVKMLMALMGVATLTQFHSACYAAVLRSQEENEFNALGLLDVGEVARAHPLG